jgi:hypothetical protein
MSGFINDDESLAQGIPAKQIGPETGSFGDAIMTRKGGTSEGVNEAYDSEPAPASGLDARLTGDDLEEERSFDPAYTGETSYTDRAAAAPIDPDIQTVAQQIADGGDHFKHDKTPHDHDRTPDDR